MRRKYRLRRRQQERTPAQNAAAARPDDDFEEEYIRTHLSTEPVDEQEAEAFLRQAYEIVGLAAPQHIHWLDGPLQLVTVLAGDNGWLYIEDRLKESISPSVWDSLKDSDEIGHIETGESRLMSIDYQVTRARVNATAHGISHRVWESVRDHVGWRVWQGVAESLNRSLPRWIRDCIWGNDDYSLWFSIRAYDESPGLAFALFSDTYFAHNQAHALAHFNQMVSGYWLGKEVALVVRRPRLLSRDAEGRLHSETSRCIEYHDGWGFWAWHGVRVPEKVILAPETLTREDFLHEPNIEARRMIQERMGERFVWELEGKFIDGGPHGVLYEVELPDDPEQVARYVQVQDASTPRQYFLRVPPTIQTAAEAVAWTFNLSVDAYHPAEET